MNTDDSYFDFRFKFSGRIRRRTYWCTDIPLSLVGGITLMAYHILRRHDLDAIDGDNIGAVFRFYLPYYIICTPLYILTYGLQARRLHDIGMSGKWVLIDLLGFIPIPIINRITGIVFFILSCKDSRKETNKWGPSPKYGAGQENKEAELPAEPPAGQEQELTSSH